MLYVFYALGSDTVDSHLYPGIVKLLERYIAFLYYDRLFESVNKFVDYDPTVVKGPGQKLAVIQVVVDIEPAKVVMNIIQNESSMNTFANISRKISRSRLGKVFATFLNKLGLYDKLSTTLITGKMVSLIAASTDFKQAGVTSTESLIKMSKLGWHTIVVVNEERGFVSLCSNLHPSVSKCFTIPIKSVEKLASSSVVSNVADVFNQLKSSPFAGGLAHAILS